ncbi:23S rRNA (pseudouridine(1915)-N(3))-methyltransferase RlmH [Christensenellaceae bacterium OttesenSCG-928-K19]|nr:23S rRNA (pseudouridine(1915)-N(3))-methyltransferase RlmH [Christensenellaceae bacterium OttesenSCG-928-K19]
MKINFVCVGKLKEEYYKKAQAEYTKMLGRFCDVHIIEVSDDPLAHVKIGKGEQAVKTVEGKRVLEKCAGFVVACDGRGKQMGSEQFSRKIEDIMLGGGSEITFVVGGSLGLSDEVRGRADMVLSFSKMTLPHRLFRVVLLEQVYRAFKIMRGETYHK